MIYLKKHISSSRAIFKFILHVSQNVSYSEGLLILVTVYDITSVTNGYKRRKYHATKANNFEEILSFNKVHIV